MNQYNEFVVPNPCAGFLWLAQTFDFGRCDHLFVVFFIRLRLISDSHVGTGVGGLLEGLADRQIAELIEHRAQAIVSRVLPGCTGYESDESFEETARKPFHLVRFGFVLIGWRFAEFPRIR